MFLSPKARMWRPVMAGMTGFRARLSLPCEWAVGERRRCLSMLEEHRVFVVAGEPSGDVIGGRLIAAMKRLSPSPLQFAGIGGFCMEQEGLKSGFKMEDIAVMGVAELIPHLLTFARRLDDTVKAAVQFNPHVVITIDAKGFSFRILRKIKEIYAESGHPCPLCVHYVAPSFWAWPGGEEKLNNLSKIVDHLLCILPFEEEICNSKGLNTTFVGHPVLEDFFDYGGDSANFSQGTKWEIVGNGRQFREEHGLATTSTVVTVLPGSRMQELKKMLPTFGSALKILSQSVPDVAAIVPTVPSESLTRVVEMAVKGWDLPVVVLPGASIEVKYNAFSASNVGLTTSGTAVMQLQMARLPSIVAYRANWITEWIIRHRTKLQYISLPNILLNSPVIPEALFSSCKAEHLAFLLRTILQNPSDQQKQASAAESVLCMIQSPKRNSSTPERPSSVAACVILEAMEKHMQAHSGSVAISSKM